MQESATESVQEVGNVARAKLASAQYRLNLHTIKEVVELGHDKIEQLEKEIQERAYNTPPCFAAVANVPPVSTIITAASEKAKKQEVELHELLGENFEFDVLEDLPRPLYNRLQNIDVRDTVSGKPRARR